MKSGLGEVLLCTKLGSAFKALDVGRKVGSFGLVPPGSDATEFFR